MSPKRRPNLSAARSAQARPVQDVVTAKQQAGQFPGVGMTLPSYQYDRDRARRGRGSVVKPSRWKRFKQSGKLKKTLITFGVLLILVGGFLGGKFLWNAHKIFGGNILGILRSTKLKGEDQGRVNILLAGNSADDAGHNGGKLTDSMMVVSIDTKNNKAFMLSLPRDLWVRLPGDGYHKLNEAYTYGEDHDFDKDGYAKGGMGQLEEVVSKDLDIPIHYYALVNYNGMKQAVDAVGGVDINVKSEDPRGLYDPNIDWTTRGPLVKLTNGPHHLNGQQALNLARARGDSYRSYGFAGSDFTRTEHQRQLLVALKNKAVSTSTLTNPVKLSSMSDAIGGNVQTDFKFDELRRLYDLSKKVDSRNIQSLSLNEVDGKSLLAGYTTKAGQSALIPAAGLEDFSDIQAFIRRKTSNNPVVQESAKIVILNGTNTDGLAVKTKKSMAAKNYIIVDTGSALNTNQVNSVVIDNSGGKKPGTKSALAKQFGNHVTTQNPYLQKYPNADFIVVLGTDQVNPPKSSNSTQ